MKEKIGIMCFPESNSRYLLRDSKGKIVLFDNYIKACQYAYDYAPHRDEYRPVVLQNIVGGSYYVD